MSGDTCLIAGPGNNTDLLAPKVVVVDLLTGNYLSVHVNLDLVSSNYYIGEVAISITAEEIVAFSWVVDRGNGTEILHQRYNAQELPLGEMETPIYLADSSTLQPNLGKSDSFSYTDNQSNTLHKLLQHSFTLDDATTVNKDYYGSKGNVFGMTEEFSRNVQYSRSFDNDDFALSDELDNLLSKALEDGLLIIDDTLDNKLNKEILSDTIGFIEDVVIEKIAAGVQRMVNSSTINSHMIG